MSKPVVLVVGASGQVGTATLTALSAKYADKVEIRAGVRDPVKADRLRSIPSVTVVQATMGDSNLVGTLAGVSVLYINTSSTENRAELAISTAESAKQAGVKHIVVVSAFTADHSQRHTIFGAQFINLEEGISTLGIPYTFLRFPMFIENYISSRDSIVSKDTYFNCIGADKGVASISVEDIGKASAVVLVNVDQYLNTTVTIASECVTSNDFVQALSESLGREIRYVQLPYEEAKQRMLASGAAEWRADAMLMAMKLIDDSFPAYTDTHPGVFKDITGEEPMTLKEWVSKNVTLFQ